MVVEDGRGQKKYSPKWGQAVRSAHLRRFDGRRGHLGRYRRGCDLGR
jgi:hypothetical protein